MEQDNLDLVDKMSRTVVLVHKKMHYKRRKDLETFGNSTVWLQFSYPGRKSLLLQAIYRQFQRLGVPGSIAPKLQHLRWEKVIEKWEKAILEDKEILTMGDINLNTLRWDISIEAMNSYDKMKRKKHDRVTKNKNIGKRSCHFKPPTYKNPR